MNHIIYDGCKNSNSGELIELHSAFQANVSNALSPIAMHYSDYTQWRRE